MKRPLETWDHLPHSCRIGTMVMRFPKDETRIGNNGFPLAIIYACLLSLISSAFIVTPSIQHFFVLCIPVWSWGHNSISDCPSHNYNCNGICLKCQMEKQRNLCVCCNACFLHQVKKEKSSSLGIDVNCVIAPDICPNDYINFHLYTRDHPNNSQVINYGDDSSPISTRFNFSVPTKLTIHGYLGHKDYTPNPELREAYFSSGVDLNLIAVDFSSLVKSPCYVEAIKNLKVVAKCTARFVDYLVRQGIDIGDIHIIGFSLGSQVAGMLPSYLKSGKLSRITGLDPAAPLLRTTGLEGILDKNDASFVDVIHTSSGGFGMLGPNGHVDFYPNGGTLQPGCQTGNALDQMLCNHQRASLLFAESIKNSEGFLAVPCASAILFFSNGCQKSDDLAMGEHVRRSARGTYYFITAQQAPFSMGKKGTKYVGGQFFTALKSIWGALKSL